MASAENNATEALDFLLIQLQEECDGQQYADCVSTLLKIYGNISKNPGDAKYKEIKTTNKAFAGKVWCFKSAQQLLVASGWSEVDDRIILLDDQYVGNVVRTLEQINIYIQINSSPANDTTSNRHSPQKNPVADENRRKQYEQMRKEKEERQRIADQIKADRRETQSRPTKDSVARPRKFGANINRFEDIGVDLNKGGG